MLCLHGATRQFNTDSIMQEARQAYIQELAGSDNLVTQLQQLYGRASIDQRTPAGGLQLAGTW